MTIKNMLPIWLFILFVSAKYASCVCLIPQPILRHSSVLVIDKVMLRPHLDGRIVGGHRINITDAPHQVSLQRSGHFCGGSIISNTWILTAAHCTYGRNTDGLQVRLGTSESSKDGELFKVKRIVQHEKFNYSNVDYDFSLLELERAIVYGNVKKAVKLPTTEDMFMDGDLCTVSGWGNTKSTTESRDWLRQAEVPIFNQELCAEKYKQYGGVTPRMICAGYLEGGKDACQGDSGGPLVTAAGVLVGVVSWGYGCAKPDYPGIYSRTTAVRDWIREQSGV